MILRVAGLVWWATLLGAVVITAAAAAASEMSRRRQRAVAAAASGSRAARSTRELFVSVLIAISCGALIGLAFGQVGRGAVIGAILIPPLDRLRASHHSGG
jgi:formate/nitrite transporter FocA (FNT family)